MLIRSGKKDSKLHFLKPLAEKLTCIALEQEAHSDDVNMQSGFLLNVFIGSLSPPAELECGAVHWQENNKNSLYYFCYS